MSPLQSSVYIIFLLLNGFSPCCVSAVHTIFIMCMLHSEKTQQVSSDLTMLQCQSL